MKVDQQMLARLFVDFRSADSVDIAEILEYERPLIYDYLLRMSGQVSRAEETIKEIYSVVAPEAEKYEDWPSFRILIYTTARNFNLDVWNAETDALENSGLAGNKEDDSLLKIDRYIRLLPGQYRETFVCTYIYQFAADDLARVVKRESEVLDAESRAILHELSARVGTSIASLQSLLSDFPLHVPRDAQSSNTVALSQVVGGIEEVEKSERRERFKRALYLLLIFTALVWLAVSMGYFDDLLKSFRG